MSLALWAVILIVLVTLAPKLWPRRESGRERSERAVHSPDAKEREDELEENQQHDGENSALSSS